MTLKKYNHRVRKQLMAIFQNKLFSGVKAGGSKPLNEEHNK